jgi:acyl-coenzyme A synthetase/AMP-(fatty) acid ligase
VVKPNARALTADELVDYCILEGLPRYKAPKIIVFMNSLPKNENKKIVKKELKKMSLSLASGFQGVRVKTRIG